MVLSLTKITAGVVTVVLAICCCRIAENSLPPERTTSACYGSAYNTFINGTCEDGSVIAVREVLVGHKHKNLSCPDVWLPSNPSNLSEEQCCRPIGDDSCIHEFTGQSRSVYFDNCTGVKQCALPCERQYINGSCQPDGFLDYSNYMKTDYHCINRSGIVGLLDDVSVEGTDVYMSNTYFPEPINQSEHGSCSVTTSGESDILITRLDLRLACTQTLTLSTCNDSAVLDCSFNKTRGISQLPTPSGNFVTLTLSNTNIFSAGHFWLHLSASDSNASVKVSCGSKRETLPTSLNCSELTTTSEPLPANLSTLESSTETMIDMSSSTLETSSTAVVSNTLKTISTSMGSSTLKTTLTQSNTSESKNVTEATTSPAGSHALPGWVIGVMVVVAIIGLVIVMWRIMIFVNPRQVGPEKRQQRRNHNSSVYSANHVSTGSSGSVSQYPPSSYSSSRER